MIVDRHNKKQVFSMDSIKRTHRTLLTIFGFVFLGLLYGCNSSSDLDRDGDGEPDPYGLEQRPTLGAHNIPLNNPTADVGFENAFPNLPSFTQPVFLTHSGDGTDRLFVVRQPGVIKENVRQ
ncbi:MAG: hypothetical protein R3F38_18985 [Gammaproteobacteria bacterium]